MSKPQQNTRGRKIVGPLVRPDYESLGDIATQARAGIASYVDRHPEQRSNAYNAAHAIGTGAGVGRGGYHMAKGFADTGILVARFANPRLDLLTGRTPAAVEVLGSGLRTGGYLADRVVHPQRAADDVRSGVRAARVALLPGASPMAENTADELARRAAIGMNQGELGANVASVLIAGPAAKPVGLIGDAAAVRLVPASKYAAQGHSPALAEYLAQPYEGMGSHWWPRGDNPPAAFRDSPYNVWAPPGIQRGEFYEGHARRDRKCYGARVPNEFPGESWKFSRLGLERYGPLAAIYHGTPGPLKARVGGVGATAGSGAYSIERKREK